MLYINYASISKVKKTGKVILGRQGNKSKDGSYSYLYGEARRDLALPEGKVQGREWWRCARQMGKDLTKNLLSNL